MLEEFTILEQKVKSLIDKCETLQNEKKNLKDLLEKSEKDMYVLIDEHDAIKNENEELKNKLRNYEQDGRIKSLINKIDGAMSGIDSIKETAQHSQTNNIAKTEIIKEIVKEEKPEPPVQKFIPKEPVKETPKETAYNYGINKETANIPQKNTEIPIHISEEEDPFSNASDSSWDADIKNSEPVNTEKTSENTQKYEFEMTEEEDEYIFGEDGEEDGGFFFDEEQKQ